MRIANTGGWLVESTKRHPACHLFAVDEHGNDYFLDVSYRDIRVGQDLMLDLAERQVNRRLSRVGAGAGHIIDYVKDLFRW
jgi:hypothetical protein